MLYSTLSTQQEFFWLATLSQMQASFWHNLHLHASITLLSRNSQKFRPQLSPCLSRNRCRDLQYRFLIYLQYRCLTWTRHQYCKKEEFICSTYSSFICSTNVWIRHLIGRGVTRRQNQYEFSTCLSCVLLNHCRLHTSRPEETFQGGALFARDSDWDGEIRQIRSHAATQWGEGAGVISYNSASSLIMNHPFTHMLALTNLKKTALTSDLGCIEIASREMEISDLNRRRWSRVTCPANKSVSGELSPLLSFFLSLCGTNGFSAIRSGGIKGLMGAENKAMDGWATAEDFSNCADRCVLGSKTCGRIC